MSRFVDLRWEGALPDWYYPEHTYNNYNLDEDATRHALDFIYAPQRHYFTYSVQVDPALLPHDVYERSARIVREYDQIKLLTSTPSEFVV